MPRISDIPINNSYLDRRVKIKPNEYKKIKELYFIGRISLRGLSRLYKVDKATIKSIIDPEFKKEKYAKTNQAQRWRKYNKKEYHTPYMRKHRKYKKQLYKQGLIG